jgi:hypothetical protein
MTPAEIIERIASARGVTVNQLRSRNQSSKVVFARQECMWLFRRLTGLSLLEVGKELGGRDHSTVISGIKRVQRFVDAHPEHGAELHRIVEATVVQQCEGAIADSAALAVELSELRARLRDLAQRIRGSVREAA